MNIGSDEWNAIIEAGAHDFGLSPSGNALDGFGVHAMEMVRFNQKMNLSTITDPSEIAIKHVIDSLAATPFLSGKQRLLDIGSGAGYPGIPLKLVKPDLDVTLIDGTARKVSFLKHVIRCLDLTGLSAFHARAEKFADSMSGKFDAVITRAVGPLAKCWQLAMPLVNRETGVLIALRGRVGHEELLSLKETIRRHNDCSVKTMGDGPMVHHYKLPFGHDQRAIVVHRLMPL